MAAKALLMFVPLVQLMPRMPEEEDVMFAMAAPAASLVRYSAALVLGQGHVEVGGLGRTDGDRPADVGGTGQEKAAGGVDLHGAGENEIAGGDVHGVLLDDGPARVGVVRAVVEDHLPFGPAQKQDGAEEPPEMAESTVRM